MLDYGACDKSEVTDTLEDLTAELIHLKNLEKEFVTEGEVFTYLQNDGLWVNILRNDDRRWYFEKQEKPIHKTEGEERGMLEIESEPFMRKNLYLGVNFSLTWEGEPQRDGRYFCICAVIEDGSIVGYTYEFLYYTVDCKWEMYEGDKTVVVAFTDELPEPTVEDIIYGGTIGE